jgi:hypothetical protein
MLAEPEVRRRSHAIAEVCNLVLAYLEAPPV